jgi:aminobenzoyl-glutamate utilization protein B
MRTRRFQLIGIVFSFLFFGISLFIFPAKNESAPGNNLLSWLDRNQGRLSEISRRLWEFAEPALEETRSAALLIDVLKKEGFAVEEGVAGMPTAFIASFGHGKPVIGILAEYDALPGLSQKAAGRKEAVIPGAAGHGCGHNLFGAASVGAALALKQTLADFRLPGTIRLYGCPAEETVVGKTRMARDGLFNDLAAAVVWHPADKTEAYTGSSQALYSIQVSFSGRTAHAAADPWDGRSALDGAELFNVGLNFLREHMPPTARVHYVYLDAGRAPNIVPDTAKVWCYVREKDFKSVEELYDRVLKIAQGAALMSGTESKVELVTGVRNYLANAVGTKALFENLKRVGPPRFSAEEIEFAKAIQTAMRLEPAGMRSRIESFRVDSEFIGGSTDVAEVSWITPTVEVTSACFPKDVPGHSWGVVAASGWSLGQRGMMTAAKVMALTALEFLQKPALIESMRREFLRQTKGQPYRSPLPANRESERSE